MLSNAPAASRTGFAPCKINAPPLGDHNLGLIFLLPTFLHRKVGPRRVGVLIMPLQKGDYKLAPAASGANYAFVKGSATPPGDHKPGPI